MRIVVGAQPSQRFWRLCEYSNSQRVKHQKFLLSPRRLAFETSILPSIAIHSIGNLVPHTFDPLCSRACVHHFIGGKNGKNPYTSPLPFLLSKDHLGQTTQRLLRVLLHSRERLCTGRCWRLCLGIGGPVQRQSTASWKNTRNPSILAENLLLAAFADVHSSWLFQVTTLSGSLCNWKRR